VTEDEARYEMVAALDEALHGSVTARDMTPEMVWWMLLREVQVLVDYRNAPVFARGRQ